MIYTLAAYTGLRVSELASLTDYCLTLKQRRSASQAGV